MKNFLLLFFLVFFLVGFSGFFTLNTQENAIVESPIYSSGSYTKPGLYFALPLIDKINVIYMGKRKVFLNLVLNSESGVTPDSVSPPGNIQVSVEASWQVFDSKVYLANIERNGQIAVNRILAQNIYNLIIEKSRELDIYGLNQQDNLLSNIMSIPELGVNIEEVNLTAIEKINTDKTITSVIESNSVTPKNNSPLDLQNQMIESAYYQAHKIKTQTELDEIQAYDTIKHENSKFYAYFRLIEVYKNSAKSKEDVPAFSKLYLH